MVGQFQHGENSTSGCAIVPNPKNKKKLPMATMVSLQNLLRGLCSLAYRNLQLICMCIYIYIYMGLRQNSGMDRPAVIQTYGSVWITCVLVWIGGYGSACGFRVWIGALYFDSQPYIYIYSISIYKYRKHGQKHEKWWCEIENGPHSCSIKWSPWFFTHWNPQRLFQTPENQQ